MHQKSKLTIVVPCYNEADAIPSFFREADSFNKIFLKNFPEVKLGFLFVDNNSTDSSQDLLRQGVIRSEGLLNIIECATQGYGAALKNGFEVASGDSEYIGFMDLDDTYPMKDFINLFEKIRNEKLDIVYGVRLHKSSKIEIVRFLGNFLYVSILKIFTGTKLSDACSGMRVFSVRHLSQILSLKRNDLAFSIEFTAMAVKKNWKIGECPIEYRTRIGRSKLNVITDGFIFLRTLLLSLITPSKR